MNCMTPEAEVSRGKTHQKVSGQTTAVKSAGRSGTVAEQG